MATCPKCTTELPDDRSACPVCGQRLSVGLVAPHKTAGAPAAGRPAPQASAEPAAGRPAPQDSTEPAGGPSVTDRNLAGVRHELGDRFRVEPEFQHAQRSLVYRAYEIVSGRMVALKIISTGGPLDDAVAVRFHDRARLVVGLSHPGIVPLYEYGVRRPFAWYSMEFLDWRTLDAILGRARRLRQVDDVLRLVKEVGETLAHAHEAGVVHGAMRPSNIFVHKERGARVSDFAISALYGAPGSPTTPSVLRRPEYMAPEQFESLDPVPATDQYALAILTYRGLVGRVPFTGGSFDAVRRLHESGSPPLLRGQRPDVPAGVSDAIHRALAKKPEDRFASIPEFITAMTRAARPAPRPAQAAKPAAPHAGPPLETAAPQAAPPRKTAAIRAPPPEKPRPTPAPPRKEEAAARPAAEAVAPPRPREPPPTRPSRPTVARHPVQPVAEAPAPPRHEAPSAQKPAPAPPRPPEAQPAPEKRAEPVPAPPREEAPRRAAPRPRPRPAPAPSVVPRPAQAPRRRRRIVMIAAAVAVVAGGAAAALTLRPWESSSGLAPGEAVALAGGPAEEGAAGGELLGTDSTAGTLAEDTDTAGSPTAAEPSPAQTPPAETPPATRQAQPTPTQTAAPARQPETQPVQRPPPEPQPRAQPPVQEREPQPQPPPAQQQPTPEPQAQAPPVTTPPAPAAAAGRLFINSTPWGVVYIDGERVGNTPQINLAVSAGTHVVRVEREGFQPFERQIEVGADQVIRLTDITLVPEGS